MNSGLTKLLIPMLLSSLLAACDNYGSRRLTPGVSRDADVVAQMGAPAGEWQNADGSRTLEYPKGPAGPVTFMVTVGPDGVLRTIDQVLSEPWFARVRPGMTRDEVRRLLGRPGRRDVFDLKPEEVWDWRIEGQSAGERAHFHVHFDPAGRVTGTSRSVEPGP